MTREDVRVVTCEHDLPTLYFRLKKNDFDLFRSLPLAENGIEIPHDVRIDTLFSQIFLFFDYDFQNRIGIEKVNNILSEMLEFFDNETNNGKLYVNYPMVESLKYTKKMPDLHYREYVVSRNTCANHKFKGVAEAFAINEAKQYRFIDLSKTEINIVKDNWNLLKTQNVTKAYYIVSGKDEMPKDSECIKQSLIFENQKSKYVDINETVSILNSFPLFLFDYLGESKNVQKTRKIR